MQVALLRHGIAVDRDDPACPEDEARPLTPEGRLETAAACRGLAAMDVAPERILTSPFARAQETAAIAADVLGGEPAEPHEALRPGAHPGLLFEVLGALEIGDVLCVGHAPHLDLVLAQAIHSGQGQLERLAPAGAARIAFERVAAGSGQLLWQLQPDALCALGGAT